MYIQSFGLNFPDNPLKFSLVSSCCIVDRLCCYLNVTMLLFIIFMKTFLNVNKNEYGKL